MGKDFKSYINDNPNLKNEKKPKEDKGNFNTSKEKIAETVQEIAKDYEGKTEEELMSDILKRAAAGKKDGSIDFNELDNMTKKVAPMLNPEQKERLNYIMNMIKKE